MCNSVIILMLLKSSIINYLESKKKKKKAQKNNPCLDVVEAQLQGQAWAAARRISCYSSGIDLNDLRPPFEPNRRDHVKLWNEQKGKHTFTNKRVDAKGPLNLSSPRGMPENIIREAHDQGWNGGYRWKSAYPRHYLVLFAIPMADSDPAIAASVLRMLGRAVYRSPHDGDIPSEHILAEIQVPAANKLEQLESTGVDSSAKLLWSKIACAKTWEGLVTSCVDYAGSKFAKTDSEAL